MPIQVLQCDDWYDEPKDLGDGFRLTKHGKAAVCRLFTHRFGWELRLELAGELHRSEVCRDQHAVFATIEQWKAAMVEKGWT